MESDEDDFVFYGTPIEREEDITTRKKKALAEASGQLRTLVPWKQEVRDEEGRRRFHGAFSGGFSAGYYNTVGSKEGWTPQTFTSSRKNRAEIRKQSILNFLDDDEKAEMEGDCLGTSMQFDTFGSTAAEVARKQAEKEQQQRPSAIPGPAPDEIVLPASDSIGVNLLLKMGWRRGRSVKDSHSSSRYDSHREARKAFLALSSEDVREPISGSELIGDPETGTQLLTDADDQLPKTAPAYVLNPKQDLHGLGYDPFKNAPEFREKKRSRISGNQELGHRKPFSTKDSLFGFKSERIAPGFGIGALEELDAEDEDVYASGYDFVGDTYIQEIEEPARLTIEDKKRKGVKDEHGVLRGFKVASSSDYQLERFDPPVIPKDFVPHHKFPAPLEVTNNLVDVTPQDVPPPEDKDLKIMIEGVATLVARCGKLFEDLSREKNHSNPMFSFLNGGVGHDYYLRKLWEERQKRNDHSKQQLDATIQPRQQKMTAESRGKILGEKPLERSSKDLTSSVTFQVNLSDTFTNPALFVEPPEIAKPFGDDPEKQTRFEQYLKDKYRGGLRSKDSGGASYMSEADRARERLEFEAAAVAIEKGKWGKDTNTSNQQLLDLSGSTGLQFTSGGAEQVGHDKDEELVFKKLYPKREEFQWRPTSILCKRFDLIDPYMGKPPPPPRMRSKMDSLIFMPDLVKATQPEEPATVNNKVQSSATTNENMNKDVTHTGVEAEVEVENVERPVDLYKAIFSDDSDDEDETPSLNQTEHQQKNTDAANTVLSRLVAGDFLESLGKELGLEVPQELPNSEQKLRNPNIATLKETVNVNNGENKQDPQGIDYDDNNKEKSGSMEKRIGSIENDSVKNKLGKVSKEHKEENISSSSEDEKGRKRSRSHRQRSRNADGDTSDYTSDDYQDRHRSRSKGRKKDSSSREKSGSSRKHTKHHHKRRHEHSPSSSSHHGSRKDHGESTREKRK